VLNALKAGTNALNKLHEDMSIEDVEKLLEETNEAIEVRRTIGEIPSPYSAD
jgi:charged multivesicular body protein 6